NRQIGRENFVPAALVGQAFAMEEIIHIEADGWEIVADGDFHIIFGGGGGSAGGGQILTTNGRLGLQFLQRRNRQRRIGLIDQRIAGDGSSHEKSERGSAIDDIVACIDQRNARG